MVHDTCASAETIGSSMSVQKVDRTGECRDGCKEKDGRGKEEMRLKSRAAEKGQNCGPCYRLITHACVDRFSNFLVLQLPHFF